MCNNGKMSFVINGSNPFNKGFAGCLVNIWHTLQVNYKQLEAKNHNMILEISVNNLISYVYAYGFMVTSDCVYLVQFLVTFFQQQFIIGKAHNSRNSDGHFIAKCLKFYKIVK